MDFSSINYIAVVVAAVAGFAFGSVWYMALATPWAAAQGKQPSDFKPTPMPFIIAAAGQLLMAFVLAAVLNGLGARADIGNSLAAAAVLWAGFIVTSMAVNHAFQGARRMLTLIDAGYFLGVLLIQALVLALFG